MHELKQRDPQQIGKITKNRFVARNAATIGGTRIPVAAIKRFHSAGYSSEEIISEYPSLAEEDIEAAISYREPKKKLGRLISIAARRRPYEIRSG